MITLRICIIVLSYFAQHPATYAQTIGLTDFLTNTTVTAFDLASGDFEVTSLYSIQDDQPEQRAALVTLYDATGGPYWSSLYNDSTALDTYLQYEQALLTTGTVFAHSDCMPVFHSHNAMLCGRLCVLECYRIWWCLHQKGSMVHGRIQLLPLGRCYLLPHSRDTYPARMHCRLLISRLNHLAW